MSGIIQWSPGVTLEHIEKQAVKAAYQFYKGNKSAVARSLGISVKTVEARLKDYLADLKKDNERIENAKSDRAKNLELHRGPQTPNYLSTAESLRKIDEARAAAEKRTAAKKATAGIATGDAGTETGVQLEPTPGTA